MPAVPDFQIPSWQPGIKDPMHAYDFGQLAPALRPTAANLENLLRKALATTTPDEICFVYFPPEEISFSPETRERIDDCTSVLPAIETDCDGLIYSLTKERFQYTVQQGLPEGFYALPVSAWIISIAPCAARSIFSVAVPSARAHTRLDRVIATYMPDDAPITLGRTVVHFFSRDEAEAFILSAPFYANGGAPRFEY
jgi:hypothetical protein